MLNTTDGTGRYPTPIPANTGRTVQITGKFGIFADVSAVVLAVTVMQPGSQGQLFGLATIRTPSSSIIMVYGRGGLDTMTNSSTLAIGAGAKVTITITAETSLDLPPDVQV